MNTLARSRDKAAILERLGRLQPESPRQWGRMSAHQMVCHLIDSSRMAIGERPVSPATSLIEQTLVKWLALYVPLRWPPGIVTRPEIDQLISGTCPTVFALDVEELVRQVDVFTTQPADFNWPEHPIFGRMSVRAWMRWGYLHMDHHLRQFGV